MQVIFIMSRKGGVGKSSLGLIAAIQLNALGKKCAFLDLDTQGTHLSQALPLSNSIVFEDSRSTFSSEKFLKTNWWNLSAISSGTSGFRHDIDYSGHIQRIHLSDSAKSTTKDNLESNGVESVNEVFERVVQMPMLLCSPVMSHITRTNQLYMSKDGQEAFRMWLVGLADYLMHKENAEYLIIDNSPGFSFNPATCFKWCDFELSQEVIDKGRKFACWFVSNVPLWEVAQTIYETALFKSLLGKINSKYIVNRAVKDGWNGWPVGNIGTLAKPDPADKQKGTVVLGACAAPLILAQAQPNIGISFDRLFNNTAQAKLVVLPEDKNYKKDSIPIEVATTTGKTGELNSKTISEIEKYWIQNSTAYATALIQKSIEGALASHKPDCLHKSVYETLVENPI